MKRQTGETCVCQVGVDRYDVDANIGVHAHEHGRVQSLIVSVAVETVLPLTDKLSATFDYVRIVAILEHVAGEHVDLIETFALRVAQACLDEPSNLGVEVRVEKPPALLNGMAWTSVSISRRPTRKKSATQLSAKPQ